MPLSDRQINNLRPSEKPVKVSDGGGLHLLVTPSGGKLWRMAYRFNSQQKLVSFGSYPVVGLADARAKREAAKKLMASGIDPAFQAKQDKAANHAANANTFAIIAAEFLVKNEREGKADATMAKKRWLLGLALPDLGNRPIAEISAAEILVPLRKVEALGNYESARRLRAFIGEVFRYAIATAKAANDPTYALRGALIAPSVKHMAAITNWTGFAGLLRALWSYDGTIETRAALKLMALLYARPGELRQAEWTEFDLDNAVWTIPAARMKTRRVHKKPLPALAVEILRDLQRHTGNRRLAFPSTQSADRALSENTMNAALRRLGYSNSDATAHGFRATASTLLNECGLWNPDAIEAELSHIGADEVRRAYHRASYW
ncbi:MAG: integrase arm-type DNA-binding domain-containing protein, partial [Rhizobiaceae bacterium]